METVCEERAREQFECFYAASHRRHFCSLVDGEANIEEDAAGF